MSLADIIKATFQKRRETIEAKYKAFFILKFQLKIPIIPAPIRIIKFILSPVKKIIDKLKKAKIPKKIFFNLSLLKRITIKTQNL